MYDDECGANNICRVASNTSATYRKYGSGFYLGGCTDSTFKAEMCRNNCKKYTGDSDVVFVQEGIWACCGKTTDGSNEPNCSIPLLDQAYNVGWSDKDFPGPIDETYSPAATTTVTSLESTSSASSSTALTRTADPTVNTTGIDSSSAVSGSTGDGNGSGGLNVAAIGAGVGAGVGVMLLILGMFLFWRHRNGRAERDSDHKPFLSQEDSFTQWGENKGPAWSFHPVELPSQNARPAELPFHHALVEMPYQNARLAELSSHGAGPAELPLQSR
jgi:hypothetical protein